MNWNQLKAVLWLRWRLTRHQWARGGDVGAVIAVLVAGAAVAIAATSFIAAVFVGMIVLGTAPPTAIMFAWLGLTVGFVFFWLIGLITELQRSESIDLPRLMHLPVRLGQIFVINYLASHLAISIVFFVPAMVGLSVGLAISRGPLMLLMAPLALAMVFMITAWTYCLRGWLAALMSNPRKRRSVIVGATAAIVLLAQAPNFYFTVVRRSGRRRGETRIERETRERWTSRDFTRLARLEAAVPPLWVPLGARNLAEGTAWPAAAGLLGAFAIGALGLRRAYRSTVRFYQGDTGSRSRGGATARASIAGHARAPDVPAPHGSVPAAPASGAGLLLIERHLPGVPEPAAAIALATMRSLLRAPEVKMQWGSSVLVTLILCGSLLFRQSGNGLPAVATPFIATGIIVFSLFVLVGLVANQFGVDRDGFRAFVLSPVDRRLILLGKNLAGLPILASMSVLLLLVVTYALSLSPLVLLATLCQLVVALLVAAIAGNLMSICFPYRMQPGSMKPTKTPGLSMLVIGLVSLSFPLFLLPVFIPPLVGFLWERTGGPPASLVNAVLSAVLAAGAFLLYRALLPVLGRLLERRETRILATVSVDVE